MEHFQDPHNYGKMEDPDAVGKVGNIRCVFPETDIHINSGIKQIRELEKGNRVLSHDGEYHKIKGRSKRKINEEVLMIKNKLGKDFMTLEHLVLAAKIPKTHHFSYTRRKKRFTKNPHWHHAKELEKGDMIAYPVLDEVEDTEKISVNRKRLKYDFKSKDIPSEIDIDDGFLRLAGYYLAEGCVTDEISRVRIQFSLNSAEKEIKRDITRLTDKIFGLESKERQDKPTSVEVYVNSVAMARFFKKLFGKGAPVKHIPHFMMVLPPEKQKSLILGAWRGDGCFQEEREWPRGGYKTISYQLAQQLKTLLLRQKIIPSIYTEKEHERNGVHHQKSYNVHVGQKDSVERLADILGIDFESNKEARVESWIEDGYVFNPITEIEKIDYEGEVFNLEVSESRSFTSSSLALHNCGDVMWLYIKIEDEVIKDIKFEAYGCLAAIATSSVITDLVKGKTIEEAMNLDKENVVEKLGGLPPVKVHCSVLAVDALSEAIYNYLKKEDKEIPSELEERHEKNEKVKEEIEEQYEDWSKVEEKLHEQ